MIGLIIYLLVVGIIAGYLGRLLVPGRDPMGFWATVLLGIVGSFIGGTLAALLFSGEFVIGPGSIIASIVGAVLAVLLYRSFGGRSRRRTT